MIRSIIIPLFAVIWVALPAQNYHLKVRYITMEQGLPNDFVTHAVQTNDDFVWLATNYGVCRFDGVKVELNNGVEKLQDKRPRSIFEDVNGLLWINNISYSYLANYVANPNTWIILFDRTTKTSSSFDEKFRGISPFSVKDIFYIQGDAAHNIWFITIFGDLYKYNGRFHKVATLPIHLISVAYNTPFFIAIGNNAIWISHGHLNSLYKISLNGKIEVHKVPNFIKGITIDDNDILWVATSDKYKLWRKEGDRPFQAVSLFFDQNDLEHYDDNAYIEINNRRRQIWYCYFGQILVFDFNGRLLATSSKNGNKLSIGSTNHLMIDHQDNVWFCTANGVYIMSLEKNLFTNYLTDKGVQDIRGIVVDDQNRIFINQLYVYEVSKSVERVIDYELFGSIKDKSFFWGVQGHKAVRYHFDTRQIQVFSLDTSQIQDINKNFLVPYRSQKMGILWFGGTKLLGYLNEQHSRQITLFTAYNDFSDLQDQIINCFYENEDGIWIGTSNGLYLMEEKKGIIARYREQLPNKYIQHIHEDKNGVFWLATKGGGLLRWNRQQNEIEQFTKMSGLSNDVIYAVYEDDYNHLWLPSNYGLMRFNKKTYEVNIYLPKDGIPHKEFNQASHTRAPDGRLFFGGLGGVTSFHPRDFVSTEPNTAQLQIIGFEKLNIGTGSMENFTAELIRDKKIKLRPDEKSFRLEFVLLNYKNPDENRYAYRIEGLEKNWTYFRENYIRINSLPYGEYVLHIKGQNINGQWSQHELYIPVIVEKPFYLKWWFIIISVITILFAGITIQYLRTVSIRREKLRLEAEVARRTATIEQQAKALRALDEQKSRFFLNIAHELRTPLTLIASPIEHYIQQENRNQKETQFLQGIQKNVKHLIALVESILDISRLDAHQLSLKEEPTPFVALIKNIFSMYTSYAEMHKINYELSCEVNENLVLLLDVPKFEKIIHNLLFNALKYTGKEGRVTLQIKAEERQMHVMVMDTGTGIHPDDLPHIFERYFQSSQTNTTAQGGSGIGLSIAWEYARLMKGNLQAFSVLGEGSHFIFSFPKKIASTDNIPPATATIKNGQAKKIIPVTEKAQTVLLVEDNAEMQQLLRQMIEPTHRVLSAPNGAVALEILEQHSVDAIITDLMMPQMDGFELLGYLKSHLAWQAIPVIVLTARANEEDKLHALRIGVDDYLYKPFSPQELLVRLQNLLVHRAKRLGQQQDPAMLSADQQWLREVESKAFQLLKEIPEFNISDLAEITLLSERHFRRKIQQISGLTANEYLKEIRLQYARQLLENKVMNTVSEVSYAVGFTTTHYFSKVFAERFGKKPSEYLRE